MKTIDLKKTPRCFYAFLFMFIACFSFENLNAQSTIYVITPSVGGGNLAWNLQINGNAAGSILGKVMKTIQPKGNIVIPYVSYNKKINKCIVYTEGKHLFCICG